MKLTSAILITLSCLFFSCNQPKENKNEPTVASNAPVTSITPNNNQQQSGEKLPSITLDIMQKLFDKCDYVDYLFYESNFSMSMNNKQSIQQTLTHIAEQVPAIDPNCKSIGRVFYEIEGNTEIEAEIFFSDKCQYFVFMKGQERIYANNITADGVTHFNNIFQQARQMGKN